MSTIQDDFFNVAPLLGQPTRAKWSDAVVTLLSSLDRTASEVSAGVTPVNYEYPLGDVRRYGAEGDGVTDDTDAIQAALDAAEVSGGEVTFPVGTFLVSSTLLIASNVVLSGVGPASTIKAAAAMDAIILRSKANSAPFNSNIVIRDLRIDGNRTNQTPLAEVTGMKLYSVENLLIEKCLLEEIEGHAIHLNNSGGAVDGQRITNTVVRGVGSSPTGTFGSCFAITDGTDVILTACHAYDSYKAGFRFSGTNFVFNGCVARENGNGGLVPVSGECDGITVNGGFFYNNTPDSDHPCDGIRLVGNTRVTLNGVTCYGNADCGVSIQNGCTDVTIVGGFFFNNGQSVESPGALQKRSGIAIWDNAVGNERIRISNVSLYDDQGSPTQDYGIEIADNTERVWIDDCYFDGNETGGLALLSTTDTIRVGNGNVGLSLPAFTIDAASVTGTTNTTDLLSATIAANEFGRRGVLKFRASGTFAGANGTKTISVRAGGSSLTFAATASGVIADWRLDGEIAATAVSGVRASAVLAYADITEAAYEVLTVDTTASWPFSVRGKLSNGSDTLDGQVIEFTRER